MVCYVYFIRNKSQGDGKHTKIGMSICVGNRIQTLETSFSIDAIELDYIIECYNEEQMSEIETYLHDYFNKYSTKNLPSYNSSSTEWFDKIFTVDEIRKALDDECYTNDIISDKNELDKIMTEYIKHYREEKEKLREKNREIIRKKREEREKKIKRDKQSIKDEIKWFERKYQRDIINLGLDKLSELGKFYLELATGAGKTYIVFNIFKNIKPEILFCLSPRLKINTQNIGKKYLSILGEEYEAFNLSTDENIDEFMRKDCKKVIVGCYKSIKKVYDIIDEYNINEPSMWFDESHNSVEKWTEKLDDPLINYLLKNGNIKHRLFTSASPDIDIVNNYENIFGKLCIPIKVKQLIDLKYLCPLKPMMYYHNTNDVDILQYSLDNFTELNRNWGLSFHNEQTNAMNMFEKHLEMYVQNKTSIRPYLIVSEKTEFRTVYNYNKLDDFEENKNSIAYVVRQCDMGYDYSGIDFIIFSDRKMSSKDIIQCIGRGLRPDKLGENGTNKDKECILLLPIFIDDEEKNKYKKVIEVLRYLILDLEIDVDEIIEPKYSASSGKVVSSGVDYDGLNSIKAQLIDLLESSNIINPMNKERLINFCINHNIQNQKEYNEFKKLNPYLKLKDNMYEYNDFKWKPILDPNSEIYYSSIEECENKKEELFNKLESEKDEEEMEEIYENETDEGFKYLNKYDYKFPPYSDLSYFY
jgi:superfamily II DNA or RNA helicase